MTPAAVSPTPAARYDSDGDGRIEVTHLEQLDAIRYDLDGDGKPDDDSGVDAYAAAYPVSSEEAVCNDCNGYELARPLDFAAADSYASGAVRAEWTTGVGWQPIGDGWHPFAATFNGNGHAVSNLYIDQTAQADSSRPDELGLFGSVGESGAVQEIGLLNASVAGGDFVGLLAGANRGTISHSYATGSTFGHGCIGGLVGSNDFGLINSSYTTESVSVGFKYVGGLAGCNNRGTIMASYAAGSVRGQKYVGGLVGSHKGGHISASYSTSEVTGSHYIGGLIGGNGGIVIYTYSVGRVSSDGSIDAPLQYMGGLAGYNPGIIDSSFWDTETSGQRVGIGIEIGEGQSSDVSGKTTAELQLPEGYTSAYLGWEVSLGFEGRGDKPGYTLSDYWDFGTSSEYPALKVDFDGDGTATWQEFGDQRGHAPGPAPAPAADNCMEIMATPAITAVWSKNCASGSRPGSYARFYAFTLTEPSGVIIDLESSDSDTYLYLLRGSGRTGEVLASQGSRNRSSRIEHVLGAGTYTVEAATYDGGHTGSFTLTVNEFSTPPPTPTYTPAPIPTATPSPPPTPAFMPTSTPMPPEPTNTPAPAATATPEREPALAREPAGACSYPDGSNPRATADTGMFLLAAPLTALGWLKFGPRRRRDR